MKIREQITDASSMTGLAPAAVARAKVAPPFVFGASARGSFGLSVLDCGVNLWRDFAAIRGGASTAARRENVAVQRP